MTLCPMCGNFTDNRNCEVCGIKLNNDDSDNDQQDLEKMKADPAESKKIYLKHPGKNFTYNSPPS
jgi:methionyl-tRNA synthetase